MYSLVFLFPSSMRGSWHITHTCTCIGICPATNDSCSCLTCIRAQARVPRTLQFRVVLPPLSSLLKSCSGCFFSFFYPGLDSYTLSHAVTQHTTACCSMQVVDITLAEQPSTNITSLRMVQQKHCGPKYKLNFILLQTKA
jgi:hypothetical protein